MDGWVLDCFGRFGFPSVSIYDILPYNPCLCVHGTFYSPDCGRINMSRREETLNKEVRRSPSKNEAEGESSGLAISDSIQETKFGIS